MRNGDGSRLTASRLRAGGWCRVAATMARMLDLRPSLFVLSLVLVAMTVGPSAAPSGWLLVANKGDRALGIIDPDAGHQVAAVAEGGVTGHEVIASPDGT